MERAPYEKRQAAAKRAFSAPEAFDELMKRLADLKPHPIRGCADAEDFRDRNQHLREFAMVVDRYILTLGAELKAHARGRFDMSCFTYVLIKSLEGDATFCIEQEAEIIENEVAA